MNFDIMTDKDLGWNKAGWRYFDIVRKGIRKTYLGTNFCTLKMDQLNRKMEEMGEVIGNYPAMVTVFGVDGYKKAKVEPNGEVAILTLYVEGSLNDLGILLRKALYTEPAQKRAKGVDGTSQVTQNAPSSSSSDMVVQPRSPPIFQQQMGPVQKAPAQTISAKSQGRVITDVPGVTKKQHPVIHPRTKGQDSDDEYFPSEAERNRRKEQQQQQQQTNVGGNDEMEEEEEEITGEIEVLQQGQQPPPPAPESEYHIVDLGGGNYATAPNVPSAFQKSYFGPHKDQRLSEQEYQQALNTDINQNDI